MKVFLRGTTISYDELSFEFSIYFIKIIIFIKVNTLNTLNNSYWIQFLVLIPCYSIFN